MINADIRHIENLWQFTNLRKLQLDNNIIDCIAGLDSLVNLEWLGESVNSAAALCVHKCSLYTQLTPPPISPSPVPSFLPSLLPLSPLFSL